MTYDWLAALAFIAIYIGVMVFGPRLVFQVPALAQMRALNREADRGKMARESFRKTVKQNRKAGMWLNYAFYVTVLPFCVSFDSRPLWQHVVEIVAVLLIFDFMYYWTHRLLFHGDPLRKIHALHHQARKPTHIDAHYVHPIETMIGLGLFLGSLPIVALIAGAPLHAVSAAIATLIFTHINTINHTYVNLPYFPFKSLDYLTGVHAAHHVDMNQGNYATLTMLYDWLFGTYERPVSRPTP